MRCDQIILRFLAGLLSLNVGNVLAMAQSDPGVSEKRMEQTRHLRDFQVFELRRYEIKEGKREQFAELFESYFPEAFQQLGAIAAGSFFERANHNTFTWLRGFHTMDDRAVINGAFYYGPLWKEHKAAINDLLIDSDNVLLLQPLSPERSVTILPAVDPVTEPEGARGVVVAQIFAVRSGKVDTFAGEAEAAFAAYRDAGAREAGVLITLDAKNNFPQLPVRTDGPYLVWIGIMKDDLVLKKAFNPLVERFLPSLNATGLLRGAPELVVLDPTHRSRLRW